MIKDHLLLRYLEEQDFVDIFMSGHIRLNSLDFFRGDHDEPTKDGQIDTREGLVCPIDASSVSDCSQSDGYRYCNLLCCNRLNYVQDGDTIGWYMNVGMEAFGSYVVIIKDPDEFQRRLVDAASRQDYRCLCHNVNYGDSFASSRDVFDKSSDYSYQNEWRAALYRGIQVSEPCELFIGPISDIAEWCYTAELDYCLARIFHDRDFRNTGNAEASTSGNTGDSISEKTVVSTAGNITREEMLRLFTAADQ